MTQQRTGKPARAITQADYSYLGYYGNGRNPTANYRAYNEHSRPHWCWPLAHLLATEYPGSYLDLGCAFGHLIRDLNLILDSRAATDGYVRAVNRAIGIEWSDDAAAHKVADDDDYIHADARIAIAGFPRRRFGTIVSLDFLEHHEPHDSEALIAGIARITAPTGYSIHLVGAHNPDEDISRHTEDPTHQNHEPLDWYVDRFLDYGFVFDADRTAHIRAVPAWSRTDWAGRFLVFRMPA